jgi:CheY-like chemotaxis protein
VYAHVLCQTCALHFRDERRKRVPEMTNRALTRTVSGAFVTCQGLMVHAGVMADVTHSVRRVLILEDDSALGGLLEEILRDAGYAPQLAASPHQPCGTFDLVIADYLHPYYQPGQPWPFLERLRALSRGPILGCTGHIDVLLDLPEDLGVTAVIAKPFDLDEFVRQVHQLTQAVPRAAAAA